MLCPYVVMVSCTWNEVLSETFSQVQGWNVVNSSWPWSRCGDILGVGGDGGVGGVGDFLMTLDTATRFCIFAFGGYTFCKWQSMWIWKRMYYHCSVYNDSSWMLASLTHNDRHNIYIYILRASEPLPNYTIYQLTICYLVQWLVGLLRSFRSFRFVR